MVALVKLIHVVAVVLFLGNITMGLYWVNRIKRAQDPGALAEAMDTAIASDRLVTGPSAVILATAGLALAWLSGYTILRTPWILIGLALFALSGVGYAFLAPLQRRISAYAHQRTAQWDPCARLLARWNAIGAASVAAAWLALAVMVLKPPG